jgi:hypothetical protein
MNTKNIAESSNPVLAGSWPALKRAALRARQIAEQTGTRLVVAPKGSSIPGARNNEDSQR